MTRGLTVGGLESFVDEIGGWTEVNVQVKVLRVICRNATILNVVAIKALVAYAALLGVRSV